MWHYLKRAIKFMPVRDVEDAVPYKLWKEHYEFVECGKVQVRRGRVTTPCE